ncbi:MAG: helix-turn-helix transcriptional regulator [Acidimicrobiales bacterium]
MDEPTSGALGAVLRDRRRSLSLSTKSLGAAVGVPSSTISRIETGSFKAPRPDKLARIAEILQLPASEVFALAGYVTAKDLPAFPTYLRTMHPELPDAAIEHLSGHLKDVLSEFGLSLANLFEEPAHDQNGARP